MNEKIYMYIYKEHLQYKEQNMKNIVFTQGKILSNHITHATHTKI